MTTKIKLTNFEKNNNNNIMTKIKQNEQYPPDGKDKRTEQREQHDDKTKEHEENLENPGALLIRNHQRSS